MEIAVDENRVTLVGVINEKTDMESLKNAIESAAAAKPGSRVLLDFSKVEKANSCGLLAYLRIFVKLNIPATYINSPVWLVEQFNALDDFFVGDVLVKSLYAQFYSPSTDQSFVLLQEVGTDVPVLDDYSSLEIKAKSPNGDLLEPDFEPEIYYFFIAKRHAKFRSELK